ncbi:MAG: rRNA maturation RNase YbeY, partial [Patescibacteria group bacterium]
GLNEIIIDIKAIERQARELGKSRDSELFFILVHGLLHLIGYNDETEKERLKMISLGEDFLRLL